MQLGQNTSAAIQVAAAIILVCASNAAAGDEYSVEMLTDSADGRFRFEPELLQIRTGDSVRFSSDSRVHASRSIPSMVPNEGANWSSRNGNDIVVTFEDPGVYGFKCSAHYSLGMVGLIIVDDADGVTVARQSRHPPAAAKTFDRLLDQVEADK